MKKEVAIKGILTGIALFVGFIATQFIAASFYGLVYPPGSNGLTLVDEADDEARFGLTMIGMAICYVLFSASLLLWRHGSRQERLAAAKAERSPGPSHQ